MDWCAFMSGKSLIDTLKDKFPDLFQKCPFNGYFINENAELNKNLVIILPPNVYNLYVTITNSDPSAKVVIDFEGQLQSLP